MQEAQHGKMSGCKKGAKPSKNAAEAIDTNLVEMLNLVNELQRPNMGQMGSAQRSVEKSRKISQRIRREHHVPILHAQCLG